MLSSRVARCAVILTAALGLASLAAVSSTSHEEQEQAPAPGRESAPGPRSHDPVVMPSRLVGRRMPGLFLFLFSVWLWSPRLRPVFLPVDEAGRATG
jgi:hypothetical protein